MNSVETVARGIVDGWKQIAAESPTQAHKVARYIARIEENGAQMVYERAVALWHAEAK